METEDNLMQAELDRILVAGGTVNAVSGNITTSGSAGRVSSTVNLNGLSGYDELLYRVSGVPGNYFDLKKDPPKTLEEKLQELIFMTEDDHEVCKFVKAAKAVIDKRLLDKINEHIDG